MTDKMDLDDNVHGRRALRDAAEDQIGKYPDAVEELKDKTLEEIIHELRVYQIELEIQNEELKRVQFELEESRDKYQEKYRDLFDFAPIGYFTLTHKGLITEVNLTGASLFGMPRPKLIKRGFGHFVAPESLDQWDQHILNVLGHAEKQNSDLTLRREDGSSFYARLESIRMHAPVGLPEVSQGTYLVSIAVIDISERKIAEESLKEAGAFLNTLLNAIPVPLFYKDKEGLYIGFNKSYEEFYGKTQQELVGKSVFDIAARDLAEIYHAKDLELLDNPGAQVYDSQVKDARGAVHDVVFHKSTFLDRQGHVLGLIGVILDITERKRAAEREQLLGAAIEHAADGIVITDTTGTIQYVNPAEETISGYSRDELVGQGADIFKSDKHHEDFHRNLWETIRDGNVWSGRFINKKKDGTEYNEDATISPVYDKSGNLTNFVAVKHDVTKQLELQGQLFQSQKMEAVGTLAGGLAHDFNNMLQVIQGLLDVILSGPNLPPDEIRSILKDMEKAAASGAELIKGMMVFVRKTPLELRPIELNKLVAQTKSMLSRSMPKMIEIDLLLDDDLWTINAAPNQIDQILMNLAINARDAMPDGGRLTIKTENLELDEEFCLARPGAKPGRYVMIEVSDTGTGMDKETASHIFEPFFTTKASGKGTGLGLAVVYGIVEQHNGWIICDSALSVGTTFRIYFPAIEEVPQEPYFEKKEPQRGKGETILLVDDEPDLLQIIVRLLNRANYRVITSIHGKDALELYEKHRQEIRLVILDLLMPEMDGRRCLDALQDIDPNVRVLIATGHTTPGMGGELEQAGAKGFISKPFETSQLLEEVRKIIDEK